MAHLSYRDTKKEQSETVFWSVRKIFKTDFPAKTTHGKCRIKDSPWTRLPSWPLIESLMFLQNRRNLSRTATLWVTIICSFVHFVTRQYDGMLVDVEAQLKKDIYARKVWSSWMFLPPVWWTNWHSGGGCVFIRMVLECLQKNSHSRGAHKRPWDKGVEISSTPYGPAMVGHTRVIGFYKQSEYALTSLIINVLSTIKHCVGRF